MRRAFHTIGSAWLHVGAALVFVSIAEHVIVPWFNLRDIIHGEGEFSDYGPSERTSLARTWAILTAAVILGIAWAVCVMILLFLFQTAGLLSVFDTEVERAGLTEHRSLLAAQIEQESAWNCEARSRYAAGCAQFTQPTWAQYSVEVRPTCEGVPPTDPACAFQGAGLVHEAASPHVPDERHAA